MPTRQQRVLSTYPLWLAGFLCVGLGLAAPARAQTAANCGDTSTVNIGDLEEEFYIVYDRFGRRRAIAWYYYQVAASFWPFAASAVRKFVKWGVFGWVGDLIRRVIT